MGWLKMDDQYADHPKVVAAGPYAELLDVRAMLFCARLETDGFVPYTQLAAIGRSIPAAKKKAAVLVEVGRWRDDPERGGWWIHDYLEYNPSRDDRDAEREAARDRMRKARDKKKRRTPPARSPDVRTNAQGNNGRSSDNPVPQVPTEPRTPANAGGADAASDTLFEPPPAEGKRDGPTFTRRLAVWLADEHGITTQADSIAEAHLAVLEHALGFEVNDPHGTTMGVICDLAYALTGHKVTANARKLLGRFVRNRDGLTVLRAIVTSINSGAGIPAEHADDEFALMRYASAVMGDKGKAKAS